VTRLGAALVALALAGTSCGSNPTASDVVCKHHAVLAEEYGLLLEKDGSDVARCVKDLERDRHRLGEQAYQTYASCLLAARNLVEWMACDPRKAGGRERGRP
jgi:hypothetical protein